MSKRIFLPSLNCSFLLGVAALVTSTTTSANAQSWVGNGANDYWSTTANWSATLNPGTATNLVFTNSGTNTTTYNDLTAGSNFGSITFNPGTGSGPVILSGNSITLNGNVTNANTNPMTQVINFDINEAGGVRTYQTGLVNNSQKTFDGYGAGNLIINGVISNGGLTKTGSGALYLNGVNTYTGATTFSAGAISVKTIGDGGIAGGLGAASNAASNLVFNGGALQYTGASASTDRNFTINNGINAIFNVANSGANLTLKGTNNAGSTGGLTKTGVGSLTLTQAMSYTGTTTVTAGNLVLDFSATGAPSSNIIASGGALTLGATAFSEISGAWATSPTLTIQGSGTGANTQTFGSLNIGTASNNSGVAAHLNLKGGSASAPITVNFSTLGLFSGLSQGVTLDISKGASDVVHFNTATLYGNLLGGASTVGVTLNGADWATLDSGSNVVAATYTSTYGTYSNVDVTTNATTTVGANTLRFNKAAATTVTMNGGNLGGVLVTSTVGANTTTISGTGITTTLREIAVIQNNTQGDLVINAALSSGAALTTGLVKSGSGRLILNGNNTYYGNTYVNEGTLQISSNANLGATAIPSVATGNVMIGALNLNGTLEVRGGSNVVLGSQTGNYNWRAINLGSGPSVIDVDAGTTLTVSGGINTYGQGANGITTTGALIKNNTGTLVLNGVNNNAGGLVINGGVVQTPFATTGTSVTLTKLGVSWGTGGSNPITAWTGVTDTITVGSTYASSLTPGMLIVGTGIAAGTTVKSVSGTVVTLSQSTTASSSGYYQIYRNATTASFGSGATTISVGSTAGIQVGYQVIGTGIAAGAVVTAVDTVNNTVTMDLATTGTNAGGTSYAFGGYTQSTANSTAGLAGGQNLSGNGLNGNITGIVGNVITVGAANGGANNSVMTGTWTVGASDSLGIGDVAVNSGTLDLGGGVHQSVQNISITSGLIKNGTLQGTSYSAAVGSGSTATISANLAGANSVGFTKSGDGLTILSGSNTYAGATVITGGTLRVDGSLAAASAVSVSGNSSVLAGSGTVGGTVTSTDATIDGNGLKVGATTLYGASKLSGIVNASSITVAGGTTTLTGTASGALSVGSGATLAGTGYSSGATTVNGTTNPGVNGSTGKLTLDLTYNSGATANFNVSSTSTTSGLKANGTNLYYSQVVVTGAAGADSLQIGATDQTLTNGLSNSGVTLSLSMSAADFATLVANAANSYMGGAANDTLANFFVFDVQDNLAVNGKFETLTLNIDGVVTSGSIYYSGANDRFNGVSNLGDVTVNGQEFAISYVGNAALNSTIGGNDIVLTAVPEPSTWMGMVAGLGTLLFVRRRMYSRS